MRRTFQFFIVLIVIAALWAGILFMLSSNGMSWRFSKLLANIKYALDSPEKAVFVPATQPTSMLKLITAAPPSPTPTIVLATATLPPTDAVPTMTPAITPTALSSQVSLSGVLHQFQMWNNCGPANLAMALSYWGWKGDQRDTAAVLKPNPRDKNVMPYEMEQFVEEKTDLASVTRVGGDIEMIKAFVSAGMPVLAEKGFEGEGFDGWMGHYQVVTGYNDIAGVFTTQDSYKGADYPVPYEKFLADWRAFNYTYLVIYPKDRRQQVLDILGMQAYDNFNTQTALIKSQDDAAGLSDRDLFFALFNVGTNLVNAKDYARAASAYDSAFANYALLSQEIRPWRIMWYQTGPYFAYYYSGRYPDVINLATQTLDAASEPILEESFYWRARAYLSSGDKEAGLKDLKACLDAHPGFEPCVQEMLKLGVEPPPSPIR